MGFSIAYCVNVAAPWERRSPIIRLVVACAFGAVLGLALTILLKGYTPAYINEQWMRLAWSAFSGFFAGILISFVFLFIAAAGGGAWSVDAARSKAAA